MRDEEVAALSGRVGIFGGSFDPVTTGHLEVATRVAEMQQLDTIVFVPAAQSPFKPDGASVSAEHRVEMLRLALTQHPNFITSDYEIKKGGTSYTIDTVKFIREATDTRVSEIFLIIGADCVAGLEGWRDISELLSLVKLIVVGRLGFAESFDQISGLEQLKELVSEDIYSEIQGQFIRAIDIPVSSSEVRLAIKNNLSALQLHPAVIQYIEKNNLYRNIKLGIRSI